MTSIVINTYNRKEMLFALLRCLYGCHFPETYEVIIVDDCSQEQYGPELKKKFPKVKFYRNDRHLFLIKSRNFGWKKCHGEIVFFVDDDNEIKDTDIFVKALKILNQNPQIGILGCRTYYFDAPKTILAGSTRFNKMTGKTTFLGQNKPDSEKLEGLVETHDNPNAFFTYRHVLESTGGFSEEIIQTFSEADFSEKVRHLGLRVVQSSDLRVYHKSPKVDPKNLGTRLLGGNPKRFYYLIRNRYVFIKKWGTLFQKIIFGLFFSHILFGYYFWQAIKVGDHDYLKNLLAGTIDGLYHFLGLPLRNKYE